MYWLLPSMTSWVLESMSSLGNSVVTMREDPGRRSRASRRLFFEEVLNLLAVDRRDRRGTAHKNVVFVVVIKLLRVHFDPLFAVFLLLENHMMVPFLSRYA